MDMTIFFSVLDSTIRLTVPILLACLGGLYSERSGVFDIGIEGKMLFAAFAAGAKPLSIRPLPRCASISQDK